jgi:MFS family permease
MDDKMKGQAAGIFFLGYVLLQVAGGHLAERWSAKKLVSLCLIFWGLCAVGCGLAKTFYQFGVARFLLGVSESCVYPATIVLLAHWFPRAERARANAFWNLCQPLAVAASAPITGWLLGAYGWQTMLMLEGALPFVWLPIWWFFISDHPREAKWISPEEKNYLETTLHAEAMQLEPPKKVPLWPQFLRPMILLMIVINFFHNAQAYGCMTFFTDGLKARNFNAVQYGFLFAVPYAVTAVIMVINSWHSDKTGERRGHVAIVYILSGASLILSVLTRDNFWLSYGFMCLAIPGPFAALAPFWAIPTETMPRAIYGPVIGLVNALGNTGGFFGPWITGWLKQEYNSIAVPFTVLGIGMLLAAGLSFLLPRSVRYISSASNSRTI